MARDSVSLKQILAEAGSSSVPTGPLISLNVYDVTDFGVRACARVFSRARACAVRARTHELCALTACIHVRVGRWASISRIQ